MSIVSVLHKIEHAVIFEVLTTKMAGRVAFGEKTKYLFRQREETIMGIAIGGQNFHVFIKSSVFKRWALHIKYQGRGHTYRMWREEQVVGGMCTYVLHTRRAFSNKML